jgi:transcriptional regulator with XRE-family HTH domain
MRPWAHFYMSLAVSELPGPYTRDVNWKYLREELRLAREHLRWSLDKAATETGLNRATIHSIENIKREPGLKPELETIESLVLGYGDVLSSFFARLEQLQNKPSSRSLTVAPDPHSVLAQKGTLDADSISAESEALAELERSIGRTIVRAVRVAQAREQAPVSRLRRAPGRSRSRKDR